MRSLLDVNVLIALLDSDHSLHPRANDWWEVHSREGWASCPITQNGCVRIMSHPGYPNPVPVQAIIERLREACEATRHEFWPDDVSLLDPRVADPSRIHGPRQLTDVYLLALAIKRQGRLVTFDSSIPLRAAKAATAAGLVVL